MDSINHRFRYGHMPIRMGIIEGKLVFSLHDLLDSLYINCINVTYACRKVPDSEVFTAHSGKGKYKTKVTAVTKRGAQIALIRLSKVNMSDVINLLDWLDTVDEEKIKGA